MMEGKKSRAEQQQQQQLYICILRREEARVSTTTQHATPMERATLQQQWHMERMLGGHRNGPSCVPYM